VWYAAAYGVNMQSIMQKAYIRFFVLSPKRWVRLVRFMPWKNFVFEFCSFVGLFFRRKRGNDELLPEELVPLSRLYAADDVALTSAATQRKRREPLVARIPS
jgi:hypothetical protein